MDRTIIAPLEQTRDFDYVEGNHDILVALAAAVQDVLFGLTGTYTIVSGLVASATSPASLTIDLTAGRLYQLADADATAVGSIPQDTTVIYQQGFAAAQSVVLSTSGLASGQSRWALIQAEFSQVDAVRSGDPTGGNINFYNAANPSQPNVTSIDTVRQGVCTISVVYGTVTTTGSEVPPGASANNVGLYLVDLTYGQTQVTSGEILVAGPSVGTGVPNNYPVAPFATGLLNSHHSGTPGQAPQIKLASEVQGVLGIANGGLNSSTAIGSNSNLLRGSNSAVPTAYTIQQTDNRTLLEVQTASTVLTFPSTLATGTEVEFWVGVTGCSATTSGTNRFYGANMTAQSTFPLIAGNTYKALFDGNNWIVQGYSPSLLAVQIFTASGTYTPTKGARYVHVRAIGGGGGGGGTTSGTSNSCGGGGGSGGYGEGWYSATSQTVTIGAGGAGGSGPTAGGTGGTTSFGSLLSCTGGYGGNNDGNGAQTVGYAGSSGSATGGSISSGWVGQNGIAAAVGAGFSGNGASTPFGTGGHYQAIPSSSGGTGGSSAPANSGAGGGGGASYDLGTNGPGGNGGSGLVIVEEFA